MAHENERMTLDKAEVRILLTIIMVLLERQGGQVVIREKDMDHLFDDYLLRIMPDDETITCTLVTADMAEHLKKLGLHFIDWRPS